MNRKSLLTLAAVAATGVALATDSVTTLCRIAVPTASQREIMIGLPLVDVGGSEDSIDITKFVLTDGLPDGTTLQYRGSSGWHGWAKSDSNWVAAAGESAPEGNTFARGKGVLLTIPEGKSVPEKIYLYGQINESDAAPSLVNGYNLLGNSGTTAMTSLDGLEITPVVGDQIIIPVVWHGVYIFDYHTYTSGGWDRNFTIDVGKAFWYKH